VIVWLKNALHYFFHWAKIESKILYLLLRKSNALLSCKDTGHFSVALFSFVLNFSVSLHFDFKI